VAEQLTIRGIWSGMPDTLVTTVLTEVRQDTPEAYREALSGAAKVMHMRPQILRTQPAARQAATIRRALTTIGFEEMGARLLIQWLGARQRPMLTQFLDELGIAHEEGIVKEEVGPEPEREQLAAAVGHLTEQFPVENVRVYLQAFSLITAEEWPTLPELIP
jgi:hypothetical protein